MFLSLAEGVTSLADVQSVSRWFAALVIPLLALAGVLKCLHIMRRPTTHTICVLSIVGFLTAVMLSALWFSWISPTIGRWGSPVFFFVASLAVGASAAGVVLGIVGLVHYLCRRGSYRQGWVQASGGIVLNVLFLFWAWGLAQSVQRHISNLAPTGPRDFPDFNFRLDMPGRPWGIVKEEDPAPDTIIALARKDPEIWLMVSAEKIGVEHVLSPQTLVIASQEAMQRVAPDVTFGDAVPETVNGLQGLRFSARLTASNQDLVYSFWVARHHDCVYHLDTWGRAANAERIHREARALTAGFKLIE